MTIKIKEVGGKRELRIFIHLPAKIHRNHHNWVPPVYMDEWLFFNPKKNTAFSYSHTILLLAYRDKKPVGRIMGIINNKYNEIHNENDARFCFCLGNCIYGLRIRNNLLDSCSLGFFHQSLQVS